MKLKAQIIGDIARIMGAEVKAGEKAVTTAIRDAGTGLKSAWRAQITGAGVSARLARTIRSEAYPNGRPSLSAAALVGSKAPVIVGAHDTGPLIRSKDGLPQVSLWLLCDTGSALRHLIHAGERRGTDRKDGGFQGPVRSWTAPAFRVS